MTSRIVSRPVSTIARRSIPSPRPPVGVVQLRVRVPELHPADEVLEALDNSLLPLFPTCERGELDRIVVKDRRLDQLRLDQMAERVVDELAPGLVTSGVDVPLREPAAKIVRIPSPDALRLERVDQLHATPGRFEVDFVAAE